jgi:hypothetical protein
VSSTNTHHTTHARVPGNLDGQHVHVRPERDDGRAAGAERSDNAGAHDQVMKPDVDGGVQLVAGHATGLHLLVHQLGPLVDLSAPGTACRPASPVISLLPPLPRSGLVLAFASAAPPLPPSRCIALPTAPRIASSSRPGPWGGCWRDLRSRGVARNGAESRSNHGVARQGQGHSGRGWRRRHDELRYLPGGIF